MMSRVTGLVRETIMAHLFGAGYVFDAFVLGFRIPNLARDLFAEGALSSAFVPTFTSYLSTKSKQEARELANVVSTGIMLLVGLGAIAGVVFSPSLVWLLASGFQSVPGKFELAVHMTRIMFPFLLLVALAAQAMGILNSCNQFAVPALASTFFNIGSVVFGLALGYWAAPWLGISPIEGMAYGVVLGGALQLVWQMPSLWKSGFAWRPNFHFRHPGLVHIARLMGPAILGTAAVQINVMVNTNFASQISDPVRGFDGPVSWLGFAFRFMQLPLGLFGVAIGSATLPAISRSIVGDNLDEFRHTLSRSIGLVFLLTVPSSVGLSVLGESIIGAIYQGGHFEPYDTHQTGVALTCYALGLAGYAALKVLVPAFYALNDARTPALIGVLSIAVNWITASYLIHYTNWGHASLAFSTSIVALFSFVILFSILRQRVAGLYGRNLASSTWKISVASLAMGAAVFVSSRFILGWLGESRWAHLADLAVSIPLGLLVFYGICRWCRVVELEIATRAVRSVLPRQWAERLTFGR
ncbi:MAG: murein biosynthesis integral membrane protein MurJ [Bryobacterales bacterium]|nr:murein biosynthesis integral membrane protein MurJ [Bryobacterales bacterium]